MPGLVPSPRHLCGRRLLLASLTGSERRGDLIHGAQPRAVASSSRRMSSAARIPDWEREEGKLRQRRPASCRRPVISADVVSCTHPRLGARGGETPSKTPGLVPRLVAITRSFHQMLLVEEIAVSTWHLL